MRSATASSTQRSPSTSPARAIAASKPENLPTRRRTAKNRRLRLRRQLTHGGSNPGKSAGPKTGNPAVRNGSKRFAAHRVDVWLVRVDRYNQDDTVETWRGELPMIWQHHWNIPGPRTIGNAANADMFAI